MEPLRTTSLLSVHPSSECADSDYAVGNDQEVTFNFPQWYKCYRHASDAAQLQMESDFQTVLLENPDLAMIKDKRGDLPLHHILAEDHGSVAPVPVRVLKTLLLVRPDSIRVPDSKGLLPLHLACRYGGFFAYDAIHCLINLWPEALKVKVTLSKNKRDMLPLHIACEFGPMPSKVIKLLAEHWPQALTVRNGEGNLPLHIACRGYNVSQNTIKLLHKAYPSAICIPNNKGELPLHIVCGRRSTTALEIIKSLVQSYPDSIRIANAKGELPLHYACNGFQPLDVVRFLVARFQGALKVTDSNDMLPIHHTCKTNVPVLDVMSFLVNAYPECLTTRDKDGFLPLHYACYFRSVQAVKLFVDTNPDSVKDNRNKDGILPIEIICKSKNPSPVVAKILGSAYPNSLKSMCDAAQIPLNVAKAYYSSETFDSYHIERSNERMELV